MLIHIYARMHGCMHAVLLTCMTVCMSSFLCEQERLLSCERVGCCLFSGMLLAEDAYNFCFPKLRAFRMRFSCNRIPKLSVWISRSLLWATAGRSEKPILYVSSRFVTRGMAHFSLKSFHEAKFSIVDKESALIYHRVLRTK